MTADQLKKKLPNEKACRRFLEQMIWKNGRVCPHCGCLESWAIKGRTARPGLYECSGCRCQFTVTTKTPLHSTKLPLWTWILGMYYMVHSSKGVSSVFMGRWLGISQKTAWKLCHSIREMMDMSHENFPAVGGVVEIDEKFLGGKPRKIKGVVHRRGKGTKKQGILVMVERHGIVRAELINSASAADIRPHVERHVDKDSYLMTDQNPAYRSIAAKYAGHSYVNHSDEEYARGEVHNNTAESFNAQLERVKLGVFHWLSKEHMKRYINEIAFRWNHRQPEKTRKGKVMMKPLPVLTILESLLGCAILRGTRRTSEGGFSVCSNYA
jgi:transposase-like protein